MSREWTVRAQLTITQPDSSTQAPQGLKNGSAIAGVPQKNEAPITIVYEWTTAAECDPTSNKNHLGGPSGDRQGHAILKSSSETVRAR